MASLASTKITIGKESTPGTAVARDSVVPVKGSSGLRGKTTRKADPAIMGTDMLAGEYAVSRSVEGPIPLAPRACKAFGQLLLGALGLEATPVETPGILRISYEGLYDSCKVVAANAAHTLKLYIGTLGAENLDANLGSAGTIDVQAAAYNTILKLMQALNLAFVTLNTPANDDTVTIQYGTAAAVTFTKKAATSAPDRQFADAAGLVTCINDATYGVAGVTASAASTVVKLTPASVSIGITVTTSAAAKLIIAMYRCYKEFGSDSYSLASPASVVEDTAIQAKGHNAVVILTGTSGAYAHIITKETTLANERPSFSIQKDGYGDNYLYTGNYVNELSLKAAQQGFLDGDVSLIGMVEAGGQVASTVAAPTATPLIFQGGRTALGGKIFNFIKDFSLKINNNMSTDGYGQASLDRAYVQRGVLAIEGDCTLRLDSVSVLDRSKVASGSLTSFQALLLGSLIGTAGGQEALIIDAPYAALSDFEEADNSGRFDAKESFKVLAPGGTLYDEPIKMILVTADSGAY